MSDERASIVRRQSSRVPRDGRRSAGRLRARLLGAAASGRADRAGAAWYEEPATPEINAWIVIAPDDTVTIRIAQTELGQGVWTSNAMMVCEELQCDWSKVRPQYASANRDAREKAPEWTLNVPGNGATDPEGRRRAGLRQSRPHRRVRAFPTASIGACGRTRRRRSRTAATTCSSPAPKRASVCCSRPRSSGTCRSPS